MDDCAINRINEINAEIGFHENRISLHKQALNKLRKEKSLMMAKSKRVKTAENKKLIEQEGEYE